MTLQEEYADLKAQEQRMAKKMAEIRGENEKLSVPLALAAAEVADLQHKLKHYEKVCATVHLSFCLFVDFSSLLPSLRAIALIEYNPGQEFAATH